MKARNIPRFNSKYLILTDITLTDSLFNLVKHSLLGEKAVNPVERNITIIRCTLLFADLNGRERPVELYFKKHFLGMVNFEVYASLN